MDQTRGIDRSQSLLQQFVEVLDKRYFVDDCVLGGRFQVHKKVASALISLASDYYAKNPMEAKHYVED